MNSLFQKLLFTLTFTAAHLVAFENVSNQDLEGIRQSAKSYEENYNARNADKLADLWAEDAVYTNITTKDSLQGKEEIADYFAEQFKDSPEATLKISIDEVKPLEANKASAKGTAVLSIKDEPEQKSVFAAQFINSGGKWLLQKVFEVDIVPPVTHYEQLKDLEWLVGNWGSQTDYIDFSLKGEWGENKNFIFQNFSVNILGQKDLNGRQTIGWDPASNRVRSWMIDSDGGFGEGFWTNQGDQWVAAMNFTLPDGRKASATHIYKKLGDDTFSFAAEDRDVDGEMLPDVAPVKINKIQ